MNELENLIDEYENNFGEMIPLRMVHISEGELIKILRECLASNKPYELPDEINSLIEQGAVF